MEELDDETIDKYLNKFEVHDENNLLPENINWEQLKDIFVEGIKEGSLYDELKKGNIIFKSSDLFIIEDNQQENLYLQSHVYERVKNKEDFYKFLRKNFPDKNPQEFMDWVGYKITWFLCSKEEINQD